MEENDARMYDGLAAQLPILTADEVMAHLQTIADELREIAADLRSGKRKPWHAAASIDKRANLIAKPRGER